MNENMMVKEMDFKGFLARVVQHELDHFKGNHIGNYQVNEGTLESVMEKNTNE